MALDHLGQLNEIMITDRNNIGLGLVQTKKCENFI